MLKEASQFKLASLLKVAQLFWLRHHNSKWYHCSKWHHCSEASQFKSTSLPYSKCHHYMEASLFWIITFQKHNTYKTHTKVIYTHFWPYSPTLESTQLCPLLSRPKLAPHTRLSHRTITHPLSHSVENLFHWMNNSQSLEWWEPTTLLVSITISQIENSTHLPLSEFDYELFSFVRNLDNLRPYEPMNSQFIFVDEQSDRTHSNVHLRPVGLLKNKFHRC